jgi:hypothetical protein
MYRTILIPTLVLLAMAACKKDEEIRKSGPGYFLLTEVKNPELKNTRFYAEDSAKTEFQLGDLKASREFYFLLSNGGDNAIFDVHLETDNPLFTFAPENISRLPGKDPSGDAAFIPLISLGIIHGRQLNGVGYAVLLPMDENSATLTIRGRTIEDGDTVDLKSEFDFSVNAKKMDIRLFENEQEIDLLSPTGTGMFGFNYGGLGTIRYYHLTSSKFTIQNTGNVDVDIRIIESDNLGNYLSPRDTALLQSQSVVIQSSMIHVVLSLNSDGTVTDDARIQLGNDGKGYFAILIYNE